jgi:hypothetical protein
MPPPLMWATRESAAKLKTESHGKVASWWHHPEKALMLAEYPQEDTVVSFSLALNKHITCDGHTEVIHFPLLRSDGHAWPSSSIDYDDGYLSTKVGQLASFGKCSSVVSCGDGDEEGHAGNLCVLVPWLYRGGYGA